VSAPLISIVLPTRNGMSTLPALLDAFDRQQVDGTFEVVAVDSSSTDGTADLLRRRADTLISIPARAFDHGLTRNLGVERARGELVVLTVQDALPASDTWLAELTRPLRADPSLAGAFARQQPRPDASALTRHYAARAIAASDVPRTVTVNREQFAALSPMDRLFQCSFDNVCSCIRRSVWNRHPFRPTPIAEDVEWATEILLTGHRLAYVPAATVVHSHDRPVRYEFIRTYLLHQRLYRLLQLRTIPGLPSLLRSIAASVVVHVRCERSAPHAERSLRTFARAVALAFAWPLGQYLGGLTAAWRHDASRPVPQ
jgi:rhamnosyltransferase